VGGFSLDVQPAGSELLGAGRRSVIDSPLCTSVTFESSLVLVMDSGIEPAEVLGIAKSPIYKKAGVIILCDCEVPVCPTIRDMHQQCSGASTYQILFTQVHNNLQNLTIYNQQCGCNN
jgi:hypothetical protein